MIVDPRNMIKRSVVTKGGDDANNRFPIQQIAYNGKVADSEMLFPYGMHANVKAGISLGITWAIEGQEDYRVTMAYTPEERPPAEEGEVVFYHPLTLTKMHYRNNGDLDIAVAGENGDLNLTIKKDLNITVNGDVNLTVSGVGAIDIPTTTWTGDIVLIGNINQTGALTVSGVATVGALASTGAAGAASVTGGLGVTGSLTSNGKDVSDSHSHTQPNTSANATVQGNTGAPV